MSTACHSNVNELAEAIESLHEVLEAAGACRNKMVLYSIFRARRELCMATQDAAGARHWGLKVEDIKAEVERHDSEEDREGMLLERIIAPSEVAVELARGSLMTAKILVQTEGRDYTISCRYREPDHEERIIEGSPVGLALAFGREEVATYLVEHDADLGIAVCQYEQGDAARKSSYPIEIALQKGYEKASRAMFNKGEKLDRKVSADGKTILLRDAIRSKKAMASLVDKLGYGHLIGRQQVTETASGR